MSSFKKELADSKFTAEQISPFLKACKDQEFEVQGCEITHLYDDNNNFLRVEVIPYGKFLNPKLEELYDLYDGITYPQFNYSDFALYRHQEGLPDKGITRISL